MLRLFKFVPERSSTYAQASVAGKAATAFSAAFSMGMLIERLQPSRRTVKGRHPRPSAPSDMRFLSDHILRDIGLTRSDVLFGEFSCRSRLVDR